jgi:hypothetical protein
VLKLLLLLALVAFVVAAAVFGLVEGTATSHGLLFVGAAVAFFAGDRSLWSRA